MHAHSQRPYCGYLLGTTRKKECNLSLIVHNIHVTILVLHLYNVILMSIFIRVINDTAESNIERNRLLVWVHVRVNSLGTSIKYSLHAW